MAVAAAALVAGPTVLAFFSGGYFAGSRASAGLGAWLLVALAAAGAPGGIPRDRITWLAWGGLAGLAAWTLLSLLWAPVAGNAYGAAQIAILYLGALTAATMLLRGASAQRWVEPALAAGTLIVIGYGLSERLLPGLLTFARSVSAEGRLEQPLTYWNAMGELAAIGFVLCARLAGSADRPASLRAAAAAAAAPLGLGLYASFSRGALFACAAGLVALIVAAPRWDQLIGGSLSVLTGALAAAAAAAGHGVTGLAGSLASREREGALTLVLLAVIAVAAAVGQWIAAAHGRRGGLRLPRRSSLIVTAVICLGLAVAIVVGAKETSAGSTPLSGGAARLVMLQSNRYAYWSVALRAFGTSPVHGIGAGGWGVYWLRWRTVDEFARDAHSLELQTLAELGVVGIALLLSFLGGVVLAARAALRRRPAAAGAIAVLVVYIAHSPLDWDWQMPAVTLIAITLAGSLLAQLGPGSSDDRSAARGGRQSGLVPVP